MQWTWLLVFHLVVIIQSAPTSKKNIPVTIVYEKIYPHKNYIRNLNEKVQLLPEKVKQTESNIEISSKLDAEASKNEASIIKYLEEKMQLPSEETVQIPLNKLLATKYIDALKNHNEKAQLSLQELNETLPINSDKEELLKLGTSNELENRDFCEKVRNVVYIGIQNLKERAVKSEMTKYIPINVWERLDVEANKFFEEIKLRYPLRQSNENLLQQFQQFTNNFLSQFTGSNSNNVSNDESQSGFPQNVINFFTGGLQQIQSSLSNLSGQSQPSSTVQNDSNVTTQAPINPLQGFVSSVQGVFSQLNPFNQGQEQKPPLQEGETQPNGPFQSIQNAFNQFGEAVNNLNPFNVQTQKPDTAGNEIITNGPLQVIQAAASQTSEVFNQLNPFQQTTTQVQDAEATKNPIPLAAQTVAGEILGGVSSKTEGNSSVSGVVQQVSETLQVTNTPLNAAVSDQVSGSIAANNSLEGGDSSIVAEEVTKKVKGNIN